VVRRFPIRRSPWALPFLVPLAARRPYAEVGGGRVVVRMGLLGHADIPIERIAAVGTMTWPWWAGVGARIARGLVAFVGARGTLVVLELTEPVTVRAPLGWNARSVAIGAEDVHGLITAIAQERHQAGLDPPAETAA
jgi:hypothetical protein